MRTVSPTPEWALVWSDEFDQPDGSTPDLTIWNYSTGGHGWGNNELQEYQAANTEVSNGLLKSGYARMVSLAITRLAIRKAATCFGPQTHFVELEVKAARGARMCDLQNHMSL